MSDEIDPEVEVDLPEEEVEEESAPESNSGPSLRDVFAARGIPVPDGVDDDVLFQHTLGALQFRNTVDDREIAELREYRSRFLQEREEDKAPTKQVDEPAKPAYLEFPSALEKYVTKDKQTGRFIPADLQFPNVKAVEAANAWLDQRNTWEQKFYSNPIDFLESVGLKDRESKLKEEIRKEILAEIQGREQATSQESQINQFWQKHGTELIQTDGKGQWKYDLYGQPVLTRKGQAFDAAIREAESLGITNPLKANEFAYKQATLQFKRNKPSAQEPVQAEEAQEEPTAEQAQQDFINKAKADDAAGKATVRSRVVNRGATVAAAAKSRVVQNPEVALKQRMLAEAKARGLSLD